LCSFVSFVVNFFGFSPCLCVSVVDLAFYSRMVSKGNVF
jgi:hypothetical protein